MENNSLIRKIIEHYDSSYHKNKFNHYKYKFLNDYQIEFYKKDISTRVNLHLIGIVFQNTWIWGWSLPNNNHPNFKIIKDVLHYANYLDTTNSDILVLLKQIMLSSRIFIKHKFHLTLILAIIFYISKEHFQFKHIEIIDNKPITFYYYITE